MMAVAGRSGTAGTQVLGASDGRQNGRKAGRGNGRTGERPDGKTEGRTDDRADYRILVSAETCGAMPSECLDRGTIRVLISVTVAGSNARTFSFGHSAG